MHEEGKEGFSIKDSIFKGKGAVVDFLTECGAATAVGAGEFAFEAAFVCDEESFFSLGVKEDAAVAFFKMGFRFEGAVGEEVECHGIGDWCAERLDEIKGERGATVGGFVEESNSGVETDGVELRLGFGSEDGVAVGKDSICGVMGRSAGASLEGGGSWEKASEGGEVSCGSGTFVTTQSVK